LQYPEESKAGFETLVGRVVVVMEEQFRSVGCFAAQVDDHSDMVELVADSEKVVEQLLKAEEAKEDHSPFVL
jgi:hypothetical protein